jgi:hypothetical protein
MPTLPITLPVVPSTVDIVVRSSDDVLAVLPAEYLTTDEHPVLDALAAGLFGMLEEHQRRADYAAAQGDVLRATEEYLDGLAGDHGSHRAVGEADADYKTRTAAWKEVSTPLAVIDLVNEILAPVTAIEAQVFESILDRWYVTDGTDGSGGDPEFYSFVGDGLTEMCPNYPDRLYEDDTVANGGYVRPQTSPGGALAFADSYGRMFVIRVPELNDVDAPRVFGSDGTPADDPGMYVTTVASGNGLAFASNDYLTADETYQAIVDAVQRTKGHGVRFQLLVDRKL